MTHKGKVIYCYETRQLFPSIKDASEYHKHIGYHSIAKNVEDKAKTAKGMHFVALESVADISKLFADERKNELMRKAAEDKLNELMDAQKKLNKQIADARKMIKKYM